MAVPKAFYGQFFTGDCYIVLVTSEGRRAAGSLDHSAHFWLGSESSISDARVAAQKTCELGQHLGDRPVHREVEAHESVRP